MQRRQFLRAAGAGAGAVGAASAPVTAQDDEESAEGDGGGGGGGGSQTVTVGPDGDFAFDPDSVSVPPGTTVVWEWDSPNHNVAPTSQPDDANWEGHPDIVDDPNTYEHTFEVEGTYEYQCDPHAQSGMVGSVEVDPDATLGGGGGGQTGPTVPASAMSLAIGIVAALSSTVAFAFFFMKYGGRAEE